MPDDAGVFKPPPIPLDLGLRPGREAGLVHGGLDDLAHHVASGFPALAHIFISYLLGILVKVDTLDFGDVGEGLGGGGVGGGGGGAPLWRL